MTITLKFNSQAQSIAALMLVFVLIVLVGCRESSNSKSGKDDDPNCMMSTHSGYKMLIQDNETREYILHIPTSYDGTSPTPLVINFHGFGGCARDFSENVGDLTGLNNVANNNNFIVAYPQAVFRDKGDVYWEPGDDGTQNITENDVYFTRQLIADLSKNYNLDQNRVYAIGYSNGGMMSYGLACAGSDFIAAAGIMSGTMLADACDATEYSSIILFHGIADNVLPYNGDQNYRSASEVVNIWLNHNNIPSTSKVTTDLNNGAVVRDVYSGGLENTSVELYTVNTEKNEPGGHVWFSEDIDGKNPNEILWDFLSRYSL